MTLCHCGSTPLNVHRTTHLVMDVTIGHTYSMQYSFKPKTLREMELGKCKKYQRFNQRQRLAVTPMATNSLEPYVPDLLQFFWKLTDRYAAYAQTMFGFSLNEPSTQQARNHRIPPGQNTIKITKKFRHAISKE